MKAQQSTPPVSARGTVPLNPFTHLWNSNKALFSTNAKPAILASLISVLVSYASSILLVLVLNAQNHNRTSVGGFKSTNTSFRSVFITLAVFMLATVVVYVYFYGIILRTILTGTRREKVQFGSLFSFMTKRYAKAMLSLLMVFAVILGVFALLVLSGLAHQPALTILLAIPASIFMLIFAFRMSYVSFIAVDDEEPQSARWILSRSAQLWNKSGGALICYFVLLIVIAIVLSVLTGGTNSSSSTQTFNANGSTHTAVASVSLVISALVEGIFTLVAYAAIGGIYNQARQIVDSDGAPSIGNSKSRLTKDK